MIPPLRKRMRPAGSEPPESRPIEAEPPARPARHDSEANQRSQQQARELLAAALAETSQPGFTGTMTLTVKVQDGTWSHPAMVVEQVGPLPGTPDGERVQRRRLTA